MFLEAPPRQLEGLISGSQLRVCEAGILPLRIAIVVDA